MPDYIGGTGNPLLDDNNIFAQAARQYAQEQDAQWAYEEYAEHYGTPNLASWKVNGYTYWEPADRLQAYLLSVADEHFDVLELPPELPRGKVSVTRFRPMPWQNPKKGDGLLGSKTYGKR